MATRAKSLRLLLGLSLGCTVATHVFAYQARRDASLGPPLYQGGVVSVYPPWRILAWGWRWGWRAPRAFQLAGMSFVLPLTICLAYGLGRAIARPGEAHWASQAELKRAGCGGAPGLVLGRHGRHVIRYTGDKHILGIGSTGSGKTASIIATILEVPHSLFIYDPKDSIYTKTAGYRATLGRVIRLAPVSPDTDQYDPLAAIRLDADDAYRDVELVVQMLTNPEGTTRRDDTTTHFAELANQFLAGVMLYGLDSGLATTLPQIHDLITRAAWQDLITVMRGHSHPEIQRAGEVTSRIADRELSGVQTTAARALRIFSDTRVAQMTSTSSFPMTACREEETPCTVYLTVPFGDLERLRPLVRLIVRQLLGYWTCRLTGWRHRLLAIIDEMPSLGRFNIVSEGLNFMREYGVQLCLLSPSFEEIIEDYGTHNNFLEGTYVQLLYMLNDPQIAERFSKRIGMREVIKERLTRQVSGRTGRSLSEDVRQEPLISATGILQMPEGMVMGVVGQAAFTTQQSRYYQHKQWLVRSQMPVPVRRAA